MTIISTNVSWPTLINVFTVAPADQQRLIELLTVATENTIRHAPGFVSSTLHRSLDGTKVTSYAQWRSMEDYQRIREHPDVVQYREQAFALATLERGAYEVVDTFIPQPQKYD